MGDTATCSAIHIIPIFVMHKTHVFERYLSILLLPFEGASVPTSAADKKNRFAVSLHSWRFVGWGYRTVKSVIRHRRFLARFTRTKPPATQANFSFTTITSHLFYGNCSGFQWSAFKCQTKKPFHLRDVINI